MNALQLFPLSVINFLMPTYFRNFIGHLFPCCFLGAFSKRVDGKGEREDS